MRITFRNLFILFFIATFSCQSNNSSSDDNSPITSQIQLPERPNILWLVAEDLSAYLPPFGDSTIETPNLSRLAAEGVIYPNLYTPCGVCSPSRAAISTGMYPTHIGANHMRTYSYAEERGLPPYEAVPPPEVKMVSELLRMNGYYCTNNYKEDYQFNKPVTAWDESSPYAHYKNREDGQPFYAIFNFTETHESGLFEPYGFRYSETRHYHSGDRNYTYPGGSMTEEETPVHVSKDTDFPIPPYLPDTEIVRRDMWKTYNNIAEMDRQLGAVVKDLEDAGLLEKTIIFFYGDHGGPLPRQKRLIYDSGLNTPLIIRYPNKQMAGKKDDQLISFIDLAPTLLSIAGVNPPEYIDGQAFLGEYQIPERKYIHAAADRFDAFTDAIRAVRDKRFKYIRNYRPEQGYYLPVTYRERIPTMKELLRLRDEGKLDSNQVQWFRESKPREELFDCLNDPHELNNIAEDPAYADKVAELSAEMDRWLEKIGDDPNLPEAELIKRLWNGSDTKPATEQPIIKSSNGKIIISCPTDGASIGYRIVTSNGDEPDVWTVYQEPFAATAGAIIQVIAHRIGYKPAKTVSHSI